MLRQLSWPAILSALRHLLTLSLRSSNMRVPAASSIMLKISAGFMLSTLVILPCMIRKLGLLMLSWTCEEDMRQRAAAYIHPSSATH